MLFFVPSKGLVAAQALLCVLSSGLSPCSAPLGLSCPGSVTVGAAQESLALLYPGSSGSPGTGLACCPQGLSDGCPCPRQDFHYRPKGSDTCLPCDCYPVGSTSRSCDRESGRCHCRPGVIGRQCNGCDSPFAEVTPSGCEGECGDWVREVWCQ